MCNGHYLLKQIWGNIWNLMCQLTDKYSPSTNIIFPILSRHVMPDYSSNMFTKVDQDFCFYRAALFMTIQTTSSWRLHQTMEVGNHGANWINVISERMFKWDAWIFLRQPCLKLGELTHSVEHGLHSAFKRTILVYIIYNTFMSIYLRVCAYCISTSHLTLYTVLGNKITDFAENKFSFIITKK